MLLGELLSGAEPFDCLTIWREWFPFLSADLTSERASHSDTRQRKMPRLNNRFISSYIMLVGFSSPIKLSNIVFLV